MKKYNVIILFLFTTVIFYNYSCKKSHDEHSKIHDFEVISGKLKNMKLIDTNIYEVTINNNTYFLNTLDSSLFDTNLEYSFIKRKLVVPFSNNKEQIEGEFLFNIPYTNKSIHSTTWAGTRGCIPNIRAYTVKYLGSPAVKYIGFPMNLHGEPYKNIDSAMVYINLKEEGEQALAEQIWWSINNKFGLDLGIDYDPVEKEFDGNKYLVIESFFTRVNYKN